MVTQKSQRDGYSYHSSDDGGHDARSWRSPGAALTPPPHTPLARKGKHRPASAGRPRPAGELGSCNDKPVTNRPEIYFQKNEIPRPFLCTSTSVSAPSKDSALSMSVSHALKEPQAQLFRGQQGIDAGFVRGCGTRRADIKPVGGLADQSASIQTSSTEQTRDAKQPPLYTLNFGSSEGILKHQSFVKILGVSRRCLVQFKWTRHLLDAPNIFREQKIRINMHVRAHLEVGSLDERVPSRERLHEPCFVHIFQKKRARDIQTTGSRNTKSSCDGIEY